MKDILSKNITEHRKRLKLTQAELAEKLNFSDKSISKWERGDGVPDVETLYKMSQLFGVTVDSLLSEEKVEIKNSVVDKAKTRLFITLLSVGLVWFICTILFAVLTMLPYGVPRTWLSFVYAVPISAIVLTVFTALWGKYWQLGSSVSLLVWSLAMAVFLTVQFERSWLLFVACIPLQALIVVWYIFRAYKKGRL